MEESWLVGGKFADEKNRWRSVRECAPIIQCKPSVLPVSCSSQYMYLHLQKDQSKHFPGKSELMCDMESGTICIRLPFSSSACSLPFISISAEWIFSLDLQHPDWTVWSFFCSFSLTNRPVKDVPLLPRKSVRSFNNTCSGLLQWVKAFPLQYLKFVTFRWSDLDGFLQELGERTWRVDEGGVVKVARCIPLLLLLPQEMSWSFTHHLWEPAGDFSCLF